MTEMSRNELTTLIEESWRRLDAVVAGLDDAALVDPDVVGPWSVKDLLGHVTAWDLLAVQYLEHWRRGESPPERDWTSTDEYNAREAARRQSWTLEQIREEAADARRRLRALLAGISAEEWAAPIALNGRERPLGEWVGGALSGPAGPGTHAAEHAAQISAWRAARDHEMTR